MKNKIIFIVHIMVFIALMYIPYYIQFETKMFGATLITLSDIVKLWIGSSLCNFALVLISYIYCVTKD